MGRSRKPRKAADDTELVEEVEESSAPAAPARKKAPLPKTHFTALLKQGVTYEFEGMVFSRGIPKQVDIKYLKKFETNGWFTITR